MTVQLIKDDCQRSPVPKLSCLWENVKIDMRLFWVSTSARENQGIIKTVNRQLHFHAYVFI